MSLTPGQRKVITAAGIGALLYGGYRLLRGDKPKAAAKKVVMAPVEAVKATIETGKQAVDVAIHPVETVKHPVKAAKKVVSPAQQAVRDAFAAKARERAKARREGKTIHPTQSGSDTSDMVMALRGKKGGEATAALGPHKGHATKRGLAQDQREKSDEPHEKAWRHLR